MALVGLTAWFVLSRGPKQRHRSLSMHVADKRSTFLFFAIVSTIGVGLMYIFMVQWFAPSLHVHPAFYVVMPTGLLCQLIAAWIPASTGRKEYIHSVFAYAMAVTMPLILAFVLISPVIAFWLKIWVGLTIIGMAQQLALLVLTPEIKQEYLPRQLGYIASFYITISLIIFSV
jgi:hypothetical protein